MKERGRIKKPLLLIKSFLKKNPDITQALHIFDISYDQYQKAITNVSFYTDTSTASLSANKAKSKT